MFDFTKAPVVDFQGGLGDCLRRLYLTNIYYKVDMARYDKLVVICACSQPCIPELFYKHPNRHNLILIDAHHRTIDLNNSGLFGQPMMDQIYNELGLDLNQRCWQKNLHGSDYNPTYYPLSKEPLPQVDFVIHFGAGHKDRRLPKELIKDLLTSLPPEFTYGIIGEENFRIPRDKSLVDLRHRPLPDVAQIAKSSKGMICTHSAWLQFSWLNNKPTFALYPDNHHEWNQTNPTNQYCFGRYRINTQCLPYKPNTDPFFISRRITDFIYQTLARQ